jgi:hypothetical protein
VFTPRDDQGDKRSPLGVEVPARSQSYSLGSNSSWKKLALDVRLPGTDLSAEVGVVDVSVVVDLVGLFLQVEAVPVVETLQSISSTLGRKFN